MSNFGHIHERVTSVIQQRPLTLLGSKNAFEYNASTAFLTSEGVNNEDPAESSSLINTYGEITRKVLRAPPSGVTTFSVLLGSPSGAMVGALDVNAQIAVNMVIPGKMGNSLSDRVASLRVPLLRLNASANAIGNTWDESNFPHWHWFDYLRDIGAAEEFAFANDYEIVYDGTFGNGAVVMGRDRTSGTDMGGVQTVAFDNAGAIDLEFLVSLRSRDDSTVSQAYAAQILVSGS